MSAAAASMRGAPFAPPRAGAGGVDVLFVAGEHSGDEHAARVAADLLRRDPNLKIAALGGTELAAAGAQLLFDLTAHSVVGLVEVLRNYGFFRDLMARTVEWVRAHRPKCVCIVDYPGFNLRLAERLRAEGISRKGGGPVAVYAYISPQIWAWKAKRRFAMARCIDELGAIFPFEPAYFADTTLPVHFVGHPFVEEGHEPAVEWDVHGPVLLLPGSRRQPIERIFPVLLAAYAEYRASGGTRAARVIYPSEPLRARLVEFLAAAPRAIADAVELVPSGQPVCGSAVLMSSGTMSLVCALAGVPGAIVYRAHPLTHFIGRRLVRIPYLGIANLILDRDMYPEYIQGAARPRKLAERLRTVMDGTAARERCRADAEELRSRLSAPRGESVAERILAVCAG